MRGGLNQYLELARSDPGLSFNPAELGFPHVAGQPAAEPGVPAAQLLHDATTRLRRPPARRYQQLGRNSRNSETTTGFSLQPNFSWVKSTHNVRGGLDMRMTWYTREINSNLFVMSFDRRFTQRAFNLSDALSGNAIASFLLGAPGGGAIDNNFYPTFRWNYYAPWIQDDWSSPTA